MPRLSFDAFQAYEWPPEEVVASTNKFVHEHFCAFDYELRDALPEEGGDLVVLLGGRSREERFAQLAGRPGRMVVVAGPRDLPISEDFELRGDSLPANLVCVYGTNIELEDRRAFALPLGVDRAKLGRLRAARRERPAARDGLVYGSFAITNMRRTRQGVVGPPHRAQLARRLGDEPWATLDPFPAWRDDPGQLREYYAQIARHRFTLSPEGFGPDCYRTWESLYLGSIPIVLRSVAMGPFAELPILFVDDYSEVTEPFLEAAWERMSARSYDLTKLMRSHYRGHFLDSVAELDSPRFVCWRSDVWPAMREYRESAARRASAASVGEGSGPA